MTRAIIICVTILIVALLILNAFDKDKDLPDPTTTVEIKEIKDHFEEEIEIQAETSEEDPDVRTGTYEFEIDKSRFHLDLEYNRASDKFKVKNISDLVSQLQIERTDTPYRAYYKNRIDASKLWGSSFSHLYFLSYKRRIFRGLWGNISGAAYLSPEKSDGMIGIGLGYAW